MGLTRELPQATKDVSRVASQALLSGGCQRGRSSTLWTIFAILVILWLLGFAFPLGGGLIRLLLIVAVIWLLWNLLTGRRSVS
jgi:hypothetical protein